MTDEAMTVAQDLTSKWQTAYNDGDAAKVADLYMQDAVWVRPNEIDKGKPEIEPPQQHDVAQNGKPVADRG